MGASRRPTADARKCIFRRGIITHRDVAGRSAARISRRMVLPVTSGRRKHSASAKALRLAGIARSDVVDADSRGLRSIGARYCRGYRESGLEQRLEQNALTAWLLPVGDRFSASMRRSFGVRCPA